jgi:hypothetical protein
MSWVFAACDECDLGTDCPVFEHCQEGSCVPLEGKPAGDASAEASDGQDELIDAIADEPGLEDRNQDSDAFQFTCSMIAGSYVLESSGGVCPDQSRETALVVSEPIAIDPCTVDVIYSAPETEPIAHTVTVDSAGKFMFLFPGPEIDCRATFESMGRVSFDCAGCLISFMIARPPRDS